MSKGKQFTLNKLLEEGDTRVRAVSWYRKRDIEVTITINVVTLNSLLKELLMSLPECPFKTAVLSRTSA
jgi:hypothetical protein